VVALAFPGAAFASTIVSFDVSGLRVAGGDGDDAITVVAASVGGEYRVTDAAGATAGVGCEQRGPDEVVCARGTEPLGWRPITVHGSYGSDTIEVIQPAAADHVTVFGDDGNDTLTGSAGPESFSGGLGDDRLDGGGGNDALSAGDGNDVLVGGGGDDWLWPGGHGSEAYALNDGPDQVDGGEGADFVDYRGRADALTLNLMSNTGWGAAGENDSVNAVESVVGGERADLITGSPGIVNQIRGGGGDDRIETFDGGPDGVDCEAGAADYAVYDPVDHAVNCEQRDEAARCGLRQPRLTPAPPPPLPVPAPPCAPPPFPVLDPPAEIVGPSHARVVRVRPHGRFRLAEHTVRCPPGGSPCAVRTVVTSRRRAPGRALPQTVRLGGTPTVAVPAGTNTQPQATLNRYGRRLLRRLRKITATLRIDVVHHGEAVTRTVRVRLSYAASRSTPSKRVSISSAWTGTTSSHWPGGGPGQQRSARISS
jgi:hypothetical protein